MPFTLIRGTFHPDLGVPDGDSVRFEPDDVTLMQGLRRRGRPLDVKTNGTITNVQLRYEGIDALEKDAAPAGGGTGLAAEARDANIGLLGPGPSPRGYVLASALEVNGRPVAMVFAGDPAEPDGGSVFLTADRLGASVNARLARRGLVYPLYYMSLYKELRDALTAEVAAARAAGAGVWPHDRSTAGFAYQAGTAARGLPPIFPKLYRRLRASGADDADEFLDSPALAAERVALPDGRFVQFDDVLDVAPDGSLRMTYPPEDLVFQEDD